MAGLKKKLAQVGQEALERLELPVNIAAGVARIELLVRVRGQGLQLLVMTGQELRITGKISGIELVE